MPCPSRLTAALGAMALLAACAASAPASLAPGSDPGTARRLLAEMAAAGPVPVIWRGEAPLARPDLLRAVEQGVRGLAIEATAGGEAPGRRFAFDFTGDGASPCGDPADRIVPTAFRVRAAFCEGDRAIALAEAEPHGDPARLIWRLVGRLVPDDYQQTYGFGILGNRVGIGGDFGF